MNIVSRAKVISIKEYSEDLREYILELDNYKRYDVGTFLQLTLEDVTASDYWPESRTFSIASRYNKENKTIKLIIRKIGKYTEKIFSELLVGAFCTVKYAFGDMMLPQFDSINNIVCIAAGSGIAPFLSFIEELENKSQISRFELFYTVRKRNDFISYDYIKKTVEEEKLHLFVTDKNNDLDNSRLLNVNDIINGENYKDKHYYICGSKEFISFFKKELLDIGVKKIYLDEWE